MVHKGTKELVTKRLLLRKYKMEDAQEIFDHYANDSDVSKFLSWDPHGTIDVTKDLLRQWTKDYKNLNNYNWVIVYEGEVVGSIGLHNPNDEVMEAEAGYCLAKKCWGKGIMPEALEAVLHYAFDEVGFHRIFAKHDVDNPNSGKVMRKCKMTYIKTDMAPFALNPEESHVCDIYEILNPNESSKLMK